VDDVPGALTALVERFKEERREGERFHEWSRRIPNKELRGTIRSVGRNRGRG
jgi:sulfite reductase beta subunit-like hemoprotein